MTGEEVARRLPNNSTALNAYYAFMQRAGAGNEDRAISELNRAGDDFRSKFKEIVGRDPSDNEFNRFYSDVLSNDDVSLVSRPNDLRPVLTTYVADQYGGIAQKEQEKAVGEKAKASYSQVGALIKNTLGRDATQAEIDHFSKLMASGAADEYTLGEALKQLPEYMERQDTTARENLRGELTGADQRFFQQQVLPSIQSRFAQQGRSVDSSGFASALAKVAGDVSADREKYLAGVGREDYVNRRQQTINNYLTGLQRTYQQQDYSQARADQLSDVYRGRAYQVQDYDAEKRAYDEYIRNYGTRKSGGGLLMGAVQGGISGAGTGAMVGGPWGALIGGVAGAGLGAYGGSKSTYGSY
jgi:hypothetical protein